MYSTTKHITPLGNYDVPTGWPMKPYKRPYGGTPGPPVMYEKPSDPEDEGAGYGYSNAELIQEKDIYFYHSDHLGSTSYITDKDGNATQFVCYKPYGESLVDEHNTTYEQPWKFNGKELDAETGLYYYGSRYYEPVLAMWYGVDALAEKYPNMGGYVYCAGNPVKYVDPDGNIIETFWDIANVVMDVQSLFTNVSEGDWGSAAVDAGGLVFDAAAVILPGVPGGAGTAIKATRVADKAADAVKTVDKATDASKATRIIENAEKGKAFEKKVGESLGNNKASQVTIEAADGTKTRVDFVQKKDGRVTLIEAKSSQTAPLTSNQKIAHPQIEQSGGIIRGKKGEFIGLPNGERIPPTKVDIVRPNE